MSKLRSNLCRLLLLLVTIVFLVRPLPASADGGPVAKSELWAALKEGQQIAVVTIRDKDTADIDLFISLLDKTGESHEVVFFVPLGVDATDFYVVEQHLLEFDEETTEGLDSILRQNAARKDQALHALFAGTLLANGVWLLPLWAPMLLTGCMAGEGPEATFETESSQVSIFGLDEDTDLEALISTTGLDSSVRETLSRLRGQRIAIVTLQTQPQGSGGDIDSGYGRRGETGIHLSWTTSLVPGESGGTYSYPLGTGASWSHPIELTRVYVVAPTGLDFSVSYPALGSNQSGIKDALFGGSRSRIADYYQVPAYAVEDARGDFGRIWRATYTQSNHAEDITIVVRTQTWWSKLRAGMEDAAAGIAFAFAWIVGLAFWMIAWMFFMPRFTGDSREGMHLKWYHGLIYPGINAALLIIPGAFLYMAFSMGVAAVALVLLFVALGGINILVFRLLHADRFDVSIGRALGAFLLTSLASNGAYLLLAFAYAKLSGLV